MLRPVPYGSLGVGPNGWAAFTVGSGKGMGNSQWDTEEKKPMNWLIDIYDRIRENRDRDLDSILALLRPKAASDPEIREAVRLLEIWSTKEESRNGNSPSVASKFIDDKSKLS